MKLLVLLVTLFSFSLAQCPSGFQYNAQFNKCYLIMNTRNSYQLAEQYCYNLGGHLTSIQNAYENNFLAEVVNKAAGLKFITYWIGANNIATSPDFVWTDGKNFTYSNWQGGKPEISSYYQCVYMIPGTGEWVVNVCHANEGFICEYLRST